MRPSVPPGGIVFGGAVGWGETGSEQAMKLTDIISKSAVIAKLKSNQRDEVIAELIDAVIASGAAPAELRAELMVRVLDREKRGSTGFGRGIAVPHVKHKAVTRMAAAVGLSPMGIDFSALDKQPVYSVFLLISPEDQPEPHLQAMEVIFKNLSNDAFRRFLRQALTVDDIWTLLEEADGTR
jgi:mannitol/fructose-specific phosphotransferase system IIA component (Ntr-type)